MRTFVTVGILAVLAAALAALTALHCAQAQEDTPVVSEIVIKGDVTIPREDILKQLRTKVGDRLRVGLLPQDVARIKRQGDFAAVTYSTEKVADGVRVIFDIVRNPDAPPPAPGAGGASPTEPDTPDQEPTVPPIKPLSGGTDPGPARIGVVDWSEVKRDWKAAIKLQQLLSQVARERAIWLTYERPYRERLLSLSKQEADEAARLKYHTRDPAPRDLARLDELERDAARLDTEYGQLRANPNRTPEERRRFELLQDARKLRQQEIDEMEAQLGEQWDMREIALRDLDALALEKILQLVAELAEKQELNYVFRLDITTVAGSQLVVLYGGKDITADLVEELNQKVPELTHEEPPG